MSIKKLFHRPRLATVAIAAVVAAAVAVTPSFAGSFLTRQAAHSMFVSKKSSKKLFVSQKAARRDFVSQVDAPNALAASSTAAFTNDDVPPTLIPTAELGFKTRELGLVVVTFSGSSSCTAVVSGRTCPIRIFVDGQLASTGAVPFDVAPSKTAIHTITQTAVLDKGKHVVDVAYGGSGAGNKKGDVTFNLKSWNLVVQTYPGTSGQ
jgi:hypothetical protein